MTKNGKPFTFLFKRSNRSRIFFHRVEVSNKRIQNGALAFSAIIFVSLFSVGLYGVVNGGFLSNVDMAAAATSPATAQLTTPAPIQRQTIDYSRPDESDEFSFNSGGPVDQD